MLRSIGEDQGIGIYTRNLVPRLLRLGSVHEFVLLHPEERFSELFEDFPNAINVVVKTPTKPLWDQVGVPAAARRYGVDLLFNSKFTVPLLGRRKAVMMLHGSMWFTHPEFHDPLDIAYVRAVMPQYCRRAAHLISNSLLTTNDHIRYMRVAPEKITTNYLAADDHFTRVTDGETLAEVRRRYGLPEEFILTVTKYFPGKNVPRLLEAYRSLPPAVRLPLVMVGKGVDRFLDDCGVRGTPLAREIVTPGWVDQRDLPAFYSMATLFVFPSLYEEFGIPIIEAMACGCPVLGSTTGAIPEVSGGAALQVDPTRTGEIAEGLRALLDDPGLRASLRASGLARARHFSWDRHAAQTLEVLTATARGERPRQIPTPTETAA